MADTEEGEETTSRGNEWEVVSLTASAYAAAPGPQQAELTDKEKGNSVEEDEAETSHAMVMSGHFVFPPSQQENLSVEPENIKIQNVQEIECGVPELGANDGGKSYSKDEDNWRIRGLALPDEFPDIQLFDEMGNKLSIDGTEFNEGKTLQELNLIEKEQIIYSASKFGAFHSDTNTGGSNTNDENTVVPQQIEPPEGTLDSDSSQLPNPSNEDKCDDSEHPCEAWWKRGAASLYAQAKEANAFWSIFIAAAVMGVVILGQRWQQERWQTLQLKWQFSINEEKIGRMFGPISRFKDAVVGGNRRGSFIRGTSATDH